MENEICAGGVITSITDHYLTYITIKNMLYSNKPKKDNSKLVKRVDYHRINNEISDVDLDLVVGEEDLNMMYNNLIFYLKKVCDDNTSYVKGSRYYLDKRNGWMSNSILRSIRKRNKLKSKCNKKTSEHEVSL